MAWPDALNGNTLTAIYYNGSAFGCRTSFTGVVTPHSPGLAADGSGKLSVAWTDTTGHLNVARINAGNCSTTHNMQLTGRTVLAQTSPYGPGLVFDSTGSSNLGLVLGWVAPDDRHTVTTATWAGSATLSNISTASTTAYATSGPTLSSWVTDLYVTFRGSDNKEYRGYSEGCVPACFRPASTGAAVTSGIGAEAHASFFAYFNSTGNLAVYNTPWTPPWNPPSTPPSQGGCSATYRTVRSWPGAFQGEVTVTAGDSAINGWTVRWTLGSDQAVTQLWNGTPSVSGSVVTVRNASYNGSIPASGTTTFGFLGSGTPSSPSLTCASSG